MASYRLLTYTLMIRVGIITADLKDGSGKMAKGSAGEFLHLFQAKSGNLTGISHRVYVFMDAKGLLCGFSIIGLFLAIGIWATRLNNRRILAVIAGLMVGGL